MSTTTVRPKIKYQDPTPILAQIIVTLAGGSGLFLATFIFILIGFSILNGGKIYPGVSLAGIKLGGLSQREANDLLARNLLFPQTGKIVFKDGDQIWVASPAELGLDLDIQANSLAAYDHGRKGSLINRLEDRLQAWSRGVDLAPALTFNEQIAHDYLNQIGKQVNRPKYEASLKLEGVDVVSVPGQIGRELDIQTTLATLKTLIEKLSDGVVPLMITETPPDIMDASQQAEAARKILSEPLTLKIEEPYADDPGPWKIPPSQLAQMLIIERNHTHEGAQIDVNLSEEALSTYLGALAGDINNDPVNARFIFNDETHKLDLLESSRIGRRLDVASTIQAIQKNLAEGRHVVPMTLILTQPEVADSATGEQLGITENVVTTTSYFRGSTKERLQNIKIAAANFHGLLIPPGAVFSMADAMGNVSLDNGYSEAWIIFGGRTIKGVGGGVCQVSTTLFRAAFMAGFPIIERHPHAYRVGYYEQTAAGYDNDLAGLDATVFIPMVDLKFANDTSYWLLMETYFNPNSRSLTWKFYSTSDGRKVIWESSGLQNIVKEPDPVYEENPELAQGEVKQVDWAAEGADVTISRTVYRGGQVILSDSFSTHYLPWADVYQYGPGTKISKIMKKKNAVPTPFMIR